MRNIQIKLKFELILLEILYEKHYCSELLISQEDGVCTGFKKNMR